MMKIKRVYDSPEETDGLRILVDRLWPRGLTKEKANEINIPYQSLIKEYIKKGVLSS